jgi:hypothetical protein
VVLIDKVDLIHRFVQAYNAAQDCIDSNSKDEAKLKYRELMGVYKEIADSNMESVHKELAYDQVMKVYKGVAGMKFRAPAHSKSIAIAIVILIVSLVIFIKPEIIGLVAYELNHEPAWNAADNLFVISGVDPDAMFRETTDRTINIDAFFYDAEGADLTYLATSANGLQVKVDGDFLTFLPEPGVFGERTVTVLASDGENVVRQELLVTVVHPQTRHKVYK